MDSLEARTNPLAAACNIWLKKIDSAKQAKGEDFSKWADEGMQFFLGDKDAWDKCLLGGKGATVEDDADKPNPTFRFILTKTQELVQIYGPMLYNRNPYRSCTVRELPKIARELIVNPELEQQVQQMSQQLQQMQQQMQAASQPPQPGQPPPPAPDPQVWEQYQQLQQQLQPLQEQLNAANQQFQQMQQGMAAQKREATARATFIESYLNYTPNEFGLQEAFRQSIDEALIKGMGTLWTRAKKLESGRYAIVTEYDSVDNLVIDPDAEHWSQVKWIAQRCVEWIYDVAEAYDMDVEDLRGRGEYETKTSQAETEYASETLESESRADKSTDLIEYWKIWSRVGLGKKLPEFPDEYKDAISQFGDNVYLVVAKNVPYPLNFKPADAKRVGKLKRKKPKSERHKEKIQSRMDDLFLKVQWPIPFHLDNKWPVTPIKFHDIPNCIWPMAHMRTSLPYLKFMCWQMSFLADHCAMVSRLFAATTQDVDDEVKAKLKSGDPVTFLELKASAGQNLDQVIKFLTPPQGGLSEMLNVGGQMNREFEKSTGLNELSYATPGGMRSAAEAQIKDAVRNIRPDDMADRIEVSCAEVARKEAMAATWLLDGSDLSPVLGEAGAMLWDQLIASQDPIVVAEELEFRIEEGTAKKPNKDKRIADFNMLMQSISAVLVKLVDRGIPGPWNAMMDKMAEVHNMGDVSQFHVPPPPPPQPPPPDPNAETQKQLAQMKLQKAQMDMELAKIKVDNESKIAQAKLQAKQMGLAVDQAKAEMDLSQDAMRFDQEQSQEYQRMQLEAARMQQQAMMPQPIPQQGV